MIACLARSLRNLFLRESRLLILGFLYGVLTIAMGFVASKLGGVLTAAIVVNGAVAGPLLGVFICGILLPFINKHVCYVYGDLRKYSVDVI